MGLFTSTIVQLCAGLREGARLVYARIVLERSRDGRCARSVGLTSYVANSLYSSKSGDSLDCGFWVGRYTAQVTNDIIGLGQMKHVASVSGITLCEQGRRISWWRAPLEELSGG